MSKKRIIILIILLALIGAIVWYLFWAKGRADYYADVSRETLDKQAKILALEKSLLLWEKPENILFLADLYMSIGRNDLAEKTMVGRGEVDVLNKLGNLYLEENKIDEAENSFTKAKDKNTNPDSLKGLILVELKKGDRGVAENYLNELNALDPGSASCYGAFIYLHDFKKSKSNFTKAKYCNLYGLDKYFEKFDIAQNPLYLKLETANLYYSAGYLSLAEKDILALIREKDDYRDAHILASKIYEKLGDQDKANEHKKKALRVDPLMNF